MADPTPEPTGLEAYHLGTDFGFAGGDMTAHTVARRLDDGALAIMLSFAHDPRRQCDLCDLVRGREVSRG